MLWEYVFHVLLILVLWIRQLKNACSYHFLLPLSLCSSVTRCFWDSNDSRGYRVPPTLPEHSENHLIKLHFTASKLAPVFFRSRRYKINCALVYMQILHLALYLYDFGPPLYWKPGRSAEVPVNVLQLFGSCSDVVRTQCAIPAGTEQDHVHRGQGRCSVLSMHLTMTTQRISVPWRGKKQHCRPAHSSVSNLKSRTGMTP